MGSAPAGHLAAGRGERGTLEAALRVPAAQGTEVNVARQLVLTAEAHAGIDEAPERRLLDAAAEAALAAAERQGHVSGTLVRVAVERTPKA